jgi:hypothetical protein
VLGTQETHRSIWDIKAIVEVESNFIPIVIKNVPFYCASSIDG